MGARTAQPAPVNVASPVDREALEAWMDGRGLGQGPITAFDPIRGGSQNIVVRLSRGAETYVLRHPPLHKRPESDEIMRREARVLAALDGTAVPHPRLIAAEPDAGVLGAAFYLMEPVEGFNPSRPHPEAFATAPARQHRIGLKMCDALAALGRIDPAERGLEGFGRPDGWLERQVLRWRGQLESYSAIAGYGWPDLPGHERVEAWLEANRPREWRPGLIHGDFSLANVLISPEDGDVAAIVDWELATIGDPLLDLGHLLATWPEPLGRGPFPQLDAPGLATRDELVARYAASTERSLDAIGWYRALACYRLAVLLEGTYARASAGLAEREVGDRLHAIAVDLLEQASASVAGGDAGPA